MSLESRVVWSEGMFLNPQHFQQQDRFFERYIHNKCSALGAYAWGLQDVEVDAQLLKLGKISLLRGSGVFPDGTPFSFPETDEPPPVMEVTPGIHNSVVYLAIPVRRPGAVDVLPEENTQSLARYYSSEMQVRDVTVEGGDSQTVDVGKLRLRLLLDTDDLSGYTCIGVLRVAEARDDKDVLLDPQYLPTCLDCGAAPKLSGFIGELVGLLHHRGESIAGRLADARRGGTAEIADYMLLQLINRLEPFVLHLSKIKGLHPQALYSELLQMAGELSTFVSKSKRPPALPDYLHDDLQQTFAPVMGVLREYLSMVYEQTAIALNLVEKKYGIRVSEIADRSLLTSATYVLAVRADVKDDVIRTRLPAQIKIGPVERIRQLVNAAMPGIAIKPLPVAPRQIPFRSGYTYFELDRHSEFWKELQTSGGFALHLGGDFPGIEMEFWAVRH
ncbi:type VI secretion system baseplate subunit TssK [Gilvimarinus sp. F26214L]|uniref:type VI secretion system baseplate subunit TssK n=1 Tax=Gilvimarinus sp. DZF01 TaxID=3461371 RepID=UPI0040456932